MTEGPASPQSAAVGADGRSRAGTLVDRWAPVLLCAAYLAFYRLALVVPGSLGFQVVSTLVSLAFVVWIAGAIARRLQEPAVIGANAAIGACLVVPLLVLIGLRHPSIRWIAIHLPGLVNVLVIWFAASLGALLSRLLKSANMIPPVAIVLGLVDIWTILLGGPVHKIMSSPTPVAQAVTQALTTAVAPPAVGAAPLAVAGFADFLFIAFFVSAIVRFVPGHRTYLRTICWLIGVLVAYMAVVLIFGWSLPALVPMAVVMLALHRREFGYERSEAFAMVYAAALVCAIVAVFWWFGRA